MLENRGKKNIGFVIITSTLILIVLLVWACIYIVNLFNKDDLKERREDNVVEKSPCDVTLDYYVGGNPSFKKNIQLSSDEVNDFYAILKDLEYSEPVQGLTEFKYQVTYCDTTLVIGEDDTVQKGEQNVVVTKGYDQLVQFLNKKENEFNKIFFYKVDDTIPEEIKYSAIQLEEKDQLNIKELWDKQEKKIEDIELAIVPKYMLIIDDLFMELDSDMKYVSYKDGYVALSQELVRILRKYIEEENTSEIEYIIHNDMEDYQPIYNERGVSYDTLKMPNSPHYYNIASGMKRSGGYHISIEKVNIDKEGNVEVLVKESGPEEGASVTMAITYPVCQIEFKTKPNRIVVKNEQGEIFKHLNF